MKCRNRRRQLPAATRARFFLETLEPRMVMDAAIGSDPETMSWDARPLGQDFSVEEGTIEISLMSEESANDDTLAVATQAVPESPALRRFSAAEEVQQYVIAQAVERWQELFGSEVSGGYYYPPMYWAEDLDFAALRSSVSLDGFQAAAGADVSYSATNVQVAGVDEGDLVKSDGKYLYVIREQRLTIVDVQDPRDLKVVARVTLDQPASQLYLDGDRLTVISQPSFIMPLARPMTVDAMLVIDGWPNPSWHPMLQVKVFDILDRAAPREVASFQFDGSLVQSRSVGDHIVLVTQDDTTLPYPNVNCADAESSQPGPIERMLPVWDFATGIRPPPVQSCVYETEEAYVARVSDGLLAKILPHYTSGGDSDRMPQFVTAPENVVATGLFGSQLISTTVIDVGAETPRVIDSAGVLASNAAQVYATAEHVYLATGVWSGAGETTHIVQFSLDETLDSVEVTAIGSVAGHLLNQFAMDEHEGYLRVATSQGFGREATNSVVVLQSRDEQLAAVGSATGITPGESIVAARFLGDQAFLVTFQRTDPLVALDLSDPTHPVVVGELEIPGFSSYLHPLAGGYLIGLGRDANPQNGWATDPQVSLFQVADLANPKLLDRETIAAGAQAWSPGFFDHHAISFFEEVGLFAVPFNLPEWEYGLAGFSTWNAGAVIDSIGIPQIKEAVGHFSGELDPKVALGLVRQYFPDSFADLLPSELPSVAAIREFLEKLPDDLKIHDSVDRIRQFVKDWSGETSDHELSVAELRKRVADLPEEAKNLVKRLRGRLPLDLQRLAATILGEEEPVAPTHRPRTGLWLFHIDPSAENPIEHVGTISHAQPVERSVQVGETLFTISHDSVQAHLLSHPEHKLDELFIGRVTFDDFVTLDVDGGSQQIDVLANDQLPKDATIIAVSEPLRGGKVTIGQDGRFVVYTPAEWPPATENLDAGNSAANGVSYLGTPVRPFFDASDHFSYTVKLPDGSTESAAVNVQLVQRHAGRKMAQLAVADLAKRLDIGREDVEVVHVEPRSWPDGCLGIEQPDRGCAAVITPGFVVWLRADQRRFEYHTDTDSTVALVERNDPTDSGVVPDFFRVKQDSSANPLDVLANDFPNVRFIKAPEVTAVSVPSHGGTVMIAGGGFSVSYTPAAGFQGVETFTYTVDNGPTGTVTVKVLPGDPGDPNGGGGDGDTSRPKLVGIRLEVTGSDGSPITQIELGEPFLVNVYVDDLRNDSEGVYGAYFDLAFDGSSAQVTGNIEYAADYQNGISGTVSRSGIDELGSFTGSLRPLGADERLLVSIPLEALAVGNLAIATSPADLLPQHETTIFGLNSTVPARQIQYGSIDLQIVNSFHNEVEPTDANGDGVTTPIDALPIINWINEHGAGSVTRLREVERLVAAAGTDYRRESRRFDANGDGYCTHMDVLMVFNHVNKDLARRAEAQAESDASDGARAAAVSSRRDVPAILVGPPMPGSTAIARWSARLAAAVNPTSDAEIALAVNPLDAAAASRTGGPDEMEKLLADLAESYQHSTTIDEFFAELGLPN